MFVSIIATAKYSTVHEYDLLLTRRFHYTHLNCCCPQLLLLWFIDIQCSTLLLN